jgi:hypothetical protein
MELHPRAVVVLKEMVDRMSGQRKGQGPAVNGLRLDA